MFFISPACTPQSQPLWSPAVLCHRPWGCAHRNSLFTPFISFPEAYSWASLLEWPTVSSPSFSPGISIGLLMRQNFCGDCHPTVRNRVWVFLPQSWHYCSVIHSIPAFIILVMSSLFADCSESSSTLKVHLVNTDKWPALCPPAISPSPTQVSGSTHFFQGFILQKSVLTV